MDQKLVLNKIQLILKEKGITYLTLADRLKLSHVSLRRIFSKKQITFENLIQICNFLEISLSDLFHEVEQENLKLFRFTEEQELFFAENPNYLSYFYQLRSKKTPLQIKAEFSLSEKSNAKYLKKLKGFGLLKLEGNVYVSTIELPIYWDDDGPLGEVISSSMMDELVQRAKDPERSDKKVFSQLKNLVLTKSQYAAYAQDIEKLLEKYQAQSTQNAKLKRKTDIALTSLVVFGEREFNLYNDIHEI
jgi:DNA-binding Xre family transcriptional regulator